MDYYIEKTTKAYNGDMRRLHALKPAVAGMRKVGSVNIADVIHAAVEALEAQLKAKG